MKTKLLCVMILWALCGWAATAQDIFAPADKRPKQQPAKVVIAKPKPAKIDATERDGATEFIPYRGPQNWLFTEGRHIYTGYAVPVYFAAADRAHEVVGFVVVHNQPDARHPRFAAVRSAAAAAKIHGADALVLDPALPGSNPNWYLNAVAVKWIRNNL